VPSEGAIWTFVLPAAALVSPLFCVPFDALSAAGCADMLLPHLSC